MFTEKPEAGKLVWAPRVGRYAPLAEPSGFKIVLPGPVTFTSMSVNKSGYSSEELAEAIAKLLADEVKALSRPEPLWCKLMNPCLQTLMLRGMRLY